MEFLGFAMAVQFAPDRLMGAHKRPGGWLYRKDQTGPALPVTQAERDRHVRRYGWIMLGAFPLLFGLGLTFAFLAAEFLPHTLTNLQEMIWTIPGVVVALGLTYVYLKWFSHAPAREFSDRIPLAPARPLKAVYGSKTEKSSYGKIALITLGLMALAGAALIGEDVPEGELLGTLMVIMSIPLAIGLGAAWWRWRIERSGE